MKLLFDENLSFKLIQKIKKSFPKSHHLSEFKLSSASDLAVWVKRGNLSTSEIAELLLKKTKQINNFIIDTDARLLILS